MQGFRRIFTSLTLLAASLPLAVLGSSQSISVQTDWDKANFGLSGAAQKVAMEELVATCVSGTEEQPGDVALLTWCGIVNSTYAGLASSFSAMKYARSAKTMLDRAIELSPDALQGAAKTSLGTLYYKVPCWPIGFGDSDKAEALLKEGLAVNPLGIDANYFYADYLLEQKDYDGARQHLERALKAQPRSGRELADAGRRKEIQSLIADIEGR